MKQSLKIIYSIAVFTALVFAFNSCKKDVGDDAIGSQTSSSTINSTITGRVVDESDAALSGVTVMAYGKTATTDQNGIFLFKNSSVNKERCILQFTKAGFFNRAHAFSATANTVNYVKIVMLSNAQTHTLSATTGGTITLANNASVQFQSNSFVTAGGAAYIGSVSIAFKHLSPASATFGFSIPGGDLAGINTAGDDVNLYSYGMFGVELTGSGGQPLQLATGKTATLSMPVAATQIATAPATIPLWYFDETTSLWMEEGQASLVGNKYVGTVSHFSWWNCDYQGPRATIKGKVVDCNGNPVPNIIVTDNGYFTITTNQNGEFSNWIPAAMTHAIQVLSSNNQIVSLNSQIENVPMLTGGQTFIVPDLIIPCPSWVAGSLHSCAGPEIGGFVSLSNTTGLYVFQYTINGTFNLPAIPNASLEFNAFNNEVAHIQNVSSLTIGNTLELGNILLCDTIGIANNSFTLNGGPFVNEVFVINHHSYANNFFASTLSIEQSGLSSFYPGYQFYAQLSDTILNSYTLQGDSINSGISVNGITQQHWITFTPGIVVNLLEFGSVGNKIKGNYAGMGNLYTNGGAPVPIQISGNFDIIRTQ